MKAPWLLPIAGLAIVALTLGALADCGMDHGEKTKAMTPRVEATSADILPLAEVHPLQRASRLLSESIRNPADTLHGRIEDLVLTMDRGRIDYAAVVFREFPETVYHMSFDKLAATPDGEKLFCHVAADGLDALPSFARDAWHAEADLHRVREVLGMRVRGADGESAGRIRDLLIVTEDGRIREATVGVGGFLGLGERYASINWTTAILSEGHVAIGITSDDLEALAYERGEYWENLGFAGEERDTRREEPAETEKPMDLTPSETNPLWNPATDY